MENHPPSPESGPSAEPPVQYAAYPRTAPYGSPDKLEALAKGYFGLNLAFLINLVAWLAWTIAWRGARGPEVVLIWLGGYGLMFLLVCFVTYPHNKNIGIGIGWSPAVAYIASILLGITSIFCCGIIGYVVMQTIAAAEIRRYGIKTAWFGLTKKAVAHRVAELRNPHVPPPSS